jgi:hypothetical protein
MPCAEYERLKSNREHAQEAWAQYAYQQNSHLWGVSEHKRKELLKERQAALTEATNQLMAHRDNCALCKAARP